MKCRKCHAEIPDGSKFCCACGVKQDIKQNPKRRGNGQGSVYQLPNKTWIAIKTVGYLPSDGGTLKRVTRSKSGFRTKKEALAYLPKLENAPAPKAVTFKQVYDAWEPTHRAGKSTINNYRAAIKYFTPIWNMNISEITIDDLQECMDDCPRGKRTKENMKALCGLLYKYSIPRHLATLNMGPYLIVGVRGTSAKDGLPIDAVSKIEKNIGKIKFADYVICQCYLGFRPSEFLDLNIELYNKQEKAFVGGAKTDAGRDRIVTVSPKIQPIIDRLISGRESGPVFYGENGKKLRPESYRESFYEVLEKCGIDNPITERDGVKYHKYTPHSCRHTFATLMKRVPGADKDKLQLIGHTSDEMLRHYQDVSFEDLRKITDLL